MPHMQPTLWHGMAAWPTWTINWYIKWQPRGWFGEWPLQIRTLLVNVLIVSMGSWKLSPSIDYQTICLGFLLGSFSDLAGPIEVTSLGGARYALLVIDEYSCYTFASFVTLKLDVVLLRTCSPSCGDWNGWKIKWTTLGQRDGNSEWHNERGPWLQCYDPQNHSTIHTTTKWHSQTYDPVSI